MISQILKDFSERSYLKYADWLSGVDQVSADYIRQIAAGEKTASTPSHRSNSWLELFGKEQSWMKLQNEASSELREAMYEWGHPIVVLTPEAKADDEIPIGASKFNGYPDLPASVEWPTCKFGKVHFQLQINLADLQSSQAALRYNLPATGLLLLFAFDGDGIQPGVVDDDLNEIPDLARLIYIADTTNLCRRIEPDIGHELDGEHSCSIIFSEAIDLPWTYDTEDERFSDKDAVDEFHGFNGVWDSKMFGYPMHRRTDNTSPGPEWINLFTLGFYESAPCWSWCDGENLEVYVPEKSIRAGNFTPFYAYSA